MPSASRAQHNLMAMVANDPAAAKRLGIPQKVGKEFVQADRGRHFEAHKAEGGTVKKSMPPAMMGKELAFMKKKGAPASMIKHEKAEAGMKKGGKPFAKGGGIESKGKTKGKMVKMAYGGKAC